MRRWVKKGLGMLLATELLFSVMPFATDARSITEERDDKIACDFVDQGNVLSQEKTVSAQQDIIIGQAGYVLNNRSEYSFVFEKQQPNGIWKTEHTLTKNNTTVGVEIKENFDLSTLLETDDGIITPNGKWRATLTVGKENNCSSFHFALTDIDGWLLAEKKATEQDIKVLPDGRKSVTIELNLNIRAGDNNYDGYLTERDFDDLLYFLRSQDAKSPLQKKLFDCNLDGKVDHDDIEWMFCTAYKAIYAGDKSFVRMSKDDLYNMLAAYGYVMLGDVDMSGSVKEKDLILMQQMLSGQGGTDFQRLLADVNKDGRFTIEDLELLTHEIAFCDVNGDGRRDEDDILSVYYHLAGAWQLTEQQQKEVDFNGNGRVDEEDWYLLIYCYYLNMDSNPYLGREQLYGDLFVTLGLQLGDLNGSGSFDDYDLRFMKEALAGNAGSYKYLFLGDINKDLKLDQQDLTIFTEQYMSDIPFTYTLDKNAKTMTITGVKDKNMQFADIMPEYCVNRSKYTVTAIGAKAFAGCHNLCAVYIPATVTSIAGAKTIDSPFYDTDKDNLRVNCEAKSKPAGFERYWDYEASVRFGYVMKEAGSLFEYKADAESRTITITGLKSDWYEQNGKSVEVIVDDCYLVNGEIYTVKRIDNYAFSGYMGNTIEDVELPASLEEIGYGAFADMYYLYGVNLARCGNLKKIEGNAFAYNPRLGMLFIRDNVEIIEADTLEDSIVYGSDPDDVYFVISGSGPKPGWGAYWNYIDENTVAEIRLW